MAIPNVSTSSQALASYAAQLQAIQPRNRSQENESKPLEQGVTARSSDQVTLSEQSVRNAGQTSATQANRGNEVERDDSARAVERKQLNNPEEVRSSASKSVTQALEAYVQTALI